jgi:hypothetical protein
MNVLEAIFFGISPVDIGIILTKISYEHNERCVEGSLSLLNVEL